jgi:hypothetical protein
MGKRGPKPKKRVRLKWSPEFAYAIGLITTDGSLSKNGRTIDFTSKDLVQVKNFLQCLGVKNKIGKKYSSRRYLSYRTQVGDVFFYQFLNRIGLSPNKTKTIGGIMVPQKYFFDFLRGHFDGDGTFYSYLDPRWKSSFMWYTIFTSASRKHIDWLREKLYEILQIKGHIDSSGSVFQLKYAKTESLEIIWKMYYTPTVVCLPRKRVKIFKAIQHI